MEKKNETNLILEDYKTHFYYQKSNLNISFNRVTFIFFVFLVISIIFSSEIKPIQLNAQSLIDGRGHERIVKIVKDIL